MEISVFDLFKVGIGASSSHTVGSMKAARRFVTGLHEDGLLPRTGSVRAELFGSLGATGHGHGSGSGKAVLLGLEGEDPETVDTDTVDDRVHRFHEAGRLRLLGRRGWRSASASTWCCTVAARCRSTPTAWCSRPGTTMTAR